MPEKLRIVDRISPETGIFFAVVGLLIGLIGTALSFWIFPALGLWLCGIGMLFGFSGVILHFAKNWRSIFHID